MKSTSYLILFLTALTLSSCATALRGTSQDVQFISEPAGAKAALSNGMACKTPCSIAVPRRNAVDVTFSKGGCKTYKTTLTPHISAAGYMTAGYADYDNGSVYDLTPNPVNVSLDCK